MIINCRPAKLATALMASFNWQSINCTECLRAWTLYKKARKMYKKFERLGVNDKNRHLARRSSWLKVKAAKILYEHREQHLEKGKEREVPLIIIGGEANRQKQFMCWNCERDLYAQHSKWSEAMFCRHCLATFFSDWLQGKITNEQVRKMYEDRCKEPYMSNGLWEDFRWSKKKQNMVRRKKDGST